MAKDAAPVPKLGDAPNRGGGGNTGGALDRSELPRRHFEDRFGERIPSRIRTPVQRDRWAKAAKNNLRVAAEYRALATKNTRFYYGEIAARLEAEAREIAKKVMTYTGPERRAHGGYRGGPGVPFFPEVEND